MCCFICTCIHLYLLCTHTHLYILNNPPVHTYLPYAYCTYIVYIHTYVPTHAYVHTLHEHMYVCTVHVYVDSYLLWPCSSGRACEDRGVTFLDSTLDSVESPGIGANIVFMCFEGILLFILTLFIEVQCVHTYL